MPQDAWKSYVNAHIISRVNYIMPFVAGHKIEIQKKVKNILVKVEKLMYGKMLESKITQLYLKQLVSQDSTILLNVQLQFGCRKSYSILSLL